MTIEPPAPDHDRPRDRDRARDHDGDGSVSDRLGAVIGMSGGQVWTIGVLAVVIILLLSSLRGLS